MKSIFLHVLFLFFWLSAAGQSNDTTFQYSTDLGGSEAAIGIVSSPNGYKVVGFGSRFDTTFRSGFWIGDVSNNSILDKTQWHGREGEAWSPSTNSDLLRTPEGEYIYAGGTLDTHQLWAPLVIGFDSSNQESWYSTYPRTDSNATIRAGMVLPDSGYLFFGRTSKNSTGLNDFYLLQLDQNRNQVSEHTYGGTFDDRGAGPSLVRRKTGYAISGYTDSYSAYGGRDGWLLYLTFDGQILRERIFGTQGDDTWIQISLAPDSLSLYLVQGIDTLLQPGFSPRAYQVMKLDPNGNPEWRLVLQDSLSRYANGIYTLANGDILVYGVIDIFPTHPDNYGWLAKISSQGELLWERAYQYPDHGYPSPRDPFNGIFDVIEAQNHHLLFVGETKVRDGGGQNPWIVQVDSNGCFATHCDSLPEPYRGPPTSVEEEVAETILLYPNPATDLLTIAVPPAFLPATCQLWDLSGRMVKTVDLNQSETEISVADLPKGLYGLWLFNEAGERFGKKVLVE